MVSGLSVSSRSSKLITGQLRAMPKRGILGATSVLRFSCRRAKGQRGGKVRLQKPNNRGLRSNFLGRGAGAGGMGKGLIAKRDRFGLRRGRAKPASACAGLWVAVSVATHVLGAGGGRRLRTEFHHRGKLSSRPRRSGETRASGNAFRDSRAISADAAGKNRDIARVAEQLFFSATCPRGFFFFLVFGHEESGLTPFSLCAASGTDGCHHGSRTVYRPARGRCLYGSLAPSRFQTFDLETHQGCARDRRVALLAVTRKRGRCHQLHHQRRPVV